MVLASLVFVLCSCFAAVTGQLPGGEMEVSMSDEVGMSDGEEAAKTTTAEVIAAETTTADVIMSEEMVAGTTTGKIEIEAQTTTEMNQTSKEAPATTIAVDDSEAGQKGMEALKEAIENEDLEEIAMIAQSGAAVDLDVLVGGWTALMRAAEHDDATTTRILLQAGADPEVKDSDGYTALLLAAGADSAAATQVLVDAGADLEARDYVDFTALIIAAQEDSAAAAQVLVDAGADLEARDNNGFTALMLAVNANYLGMVKLLLEAQASLDVQNREGSTALILAAKYSPSAGLMLLEAGADLGLETHMGQTAIMAACKNDNGLELTRALIQRGACLDCADFQGRALLMLAAETGSVKTAELLLASGANPAYASRGRTALAVARLHNQTEVEIVLEKAEPDVLQQLWLTVQDLRFWMVPAGVVLGLSMAALLTFVFFGFDSDSALGHFLGEGGNEPLAYEDQKTRAIKRMALRALAGNEHGSVGVYLRQAMRGLEVIACIVFPLGVAMLYLKPAYFIPAFALAYMIPAVIYNTTHGTVSQLLEYPSKIIVGSCPRGRLSGPGDPRLPRLVITCVLMMSVVAVRDGCGLLYHAGNIPADSCPEWGGLRSFSYPCGPMVEVRKKGKCSFDEICVWEHEPEPDVVHTVVLDFFISIYHDLLWPAWNLQSLELACPNIEHAEGAEGAFGLYLLGVWWLTLVWVVITALELTGVIEASSVIATQGQLDEMTKSIAEAAGSVEKLVDIGANPEVTCKLFPLPDGVYFKIGILVLDAVILDNLSVYNNLVVYNFWFAAAIALITSLSLGLHLASTSPRLLNADIQDAKGTGIMNDRLLHVLDSEQGIEAPLSLCLTSYTFCFTISGYFPLISGVASMGLSVYGVALFAYEHADLEVGSSDMEVGLE